MIFSIERYAWLLKELKKTGRRFTNILRPQKPGILLRSDIDYDLELAVTMADCNSRHDVQAVFYVLISSPFYSIFEKKSIEALRRLIDMGQHVGLHYEHSGISLNKERFLREFEALQLVVPESKPVVAWHNPSGDLPSLNAAAAQLGFTSAYDAAFFGQGKYVSDSNCARDAKHMLDAVALSKEELVQVLCHPLIWALGGDDMLEVLHKYKKHKTESFEISMVDQNVVWAKYRK